MSTLFAMLVILTVAAYVARPLLTPSETAAEPTRGAAEGELWEREKSVALIAIKEAEFDYATGKLSDDDYQVLRSDYEERALAAMDQLELLNPTPSADGDDAEATAPAGEAGIRFCTSCGQAFSPGDRFCGACGTARG